MRNVTVILTQENRHINMLFCNNSSLKDSSSRKISLQTFFQPLPLEKSNSKKKMPLRRFENNPFPPFTPGSLSLEDDPMES